MAERTSASSRPRVFSIPAGAPFLACLADAILANRLVNIDRGDPLALADLTVFLPTRRAARAFSDILAARLGNAILPQVRPLADIDEDDLLFAAAADESGAERLTLPPPISFLARHLALTRLILAWRTSVRRALLGLGERDDVRVPASAADAARLARDLARLGDDMAIAGVPWTAVRGLVGGDHARYFEITLAFLQIVAEQWPAYLAETARLDPAARRDQILRARAAGFTAPDAGKPFVVAGSTGSMPATAELIGAVSRLSNGAVVLPGLDRDLDPSSWSSLGAPGEPGATDAHPQFALKQLLTTLGLSREDVDDVTVAPSPGRARLLSEAMRPAATAERWTGFRADAAALDGVSLIAARNEQEEAIAIAIAARQAAEDANATVAIVTPDRTIARRVAAELARWGLAVDDSAGGRLDREPAGVFARLVMDVAAEATPVRVLALGKHPLAAFGMAHSDCRRAARALELAALRGRRPVGGVTGLAQAVAAAKHEVDSRTAHIPRWRRRLFAEDWDRAARLAEALGAALALLATALTSAATLSAADAVTLLRAAVTAAAADEKGSGVAVWESPSGVILDALLTDVAGAPEGRTLAIVPAEVPFFLAEMMRQTVVPRPALGTHKVHIWGTLEARLQSVDLIILGGLDEGVWPATLRTDPWLSRAMRSEVGLAPPERQLGLSAHDFVQAMAAPQVIVTRAEKRGGAPTVELRWLQRIRALAGDAAVAGMSERGKIYVDYARLIDAPANAKPQPIARPSPKPPIAARPPQLSVTEIETLIRDPYAVYAKHVLGLQPLDPLGAPSDVRVKGILIHDALGQFVKEWNAAFDGQAEARLLAIGREVLAAVADSPDVHAVWALRFRAIAKWLVGFESPRRDVEKRHAEIDGRLEVATPAGVFVLTGRADRVDTLTGDGLAIYDFKTGTPQSERSVFAGLTPQMTLEAAMAKRGAFDGVAAGRSVRDLAWLAVGRCGREEPYQSAVKRGETADVLAERAHEMLVGLVSAYADADRGYLSRARPMMERARYLGPYDHVARVREWALVESEEDVAV